MAVIKRGILGGMSGSVGNIVGTSWKGIAVIKSKPLSVANPRTVTQVAARNNLSLFSKAFSPFLVLLIQPLWNRWAVQKSGWNHFLQTNLETFVSGVFTNFADFKLSMGKLLGVEAAGVSGDRSANSLNVTWTANDGEGNALATDVAFALVYNEDLQEWYGDFTPASRVDGQMNGDLPEGWLAGHTMRAYISFRSADGYLVSNSVYTFSDIVA